MKGAIAEGIAKQQPSWGVFSLFRQRAPLLGYSLDKQNKFIRNKFAQSQTARRVSLRDETNKMIARLARLYLNLVS